MTDSSELFSLSMREAIWIFLFFREHGKFGSNHKLVCAGDRATKCC
jgi:hypothetical protein